MRWKRVAWAGWLAPALGGCHTTGPAAVPDLPPGGLTAHTQAAIDHRLHADAREAWRAVRAEYPRRAFTPEFRDGFLDGYADYLDRGGDGSPPPTPPLRYTRHPRYYTPEGHVLLKDYFLGFKYGSDVAAATGRRQFMTVPVLVADGGPAPVAEVVALPAPAVPAAPPAPVPPSDRPAVPPQPLPPPTTAPLAASPAPAPQATPPASGNRVGYYSGSWDRDRAKAPAAAPPPARPAAPLALDLSGSKFAPGPSAVPLTATAAPAPATVPVGLPTMRLPEPPAAVPTLPAHVPTPSVMDDIPVLPPTHTLPPPLPATHPDVTR
jgi:hypothetical protein